MRDGDFLVEKHCVGGIIPDRVTEAKRSIFNVAVPHNEGTLRGGGLKVRTQAENVGGAVSIRNLLASGGRKVQNERAAGIGGDAVHIFALVCAPTLDDPMGEDAVRRSGRGAGHRHHLGFVKVEVGVHRQRARQTTVAHILHYRTFRAVEFVPPLRVEVQFLGNPKTVSTVKADSIAVVGCSIRAVRVSRVVDGILEVSPFVHPVCQINPLDVVGGNAVLVQRVGLGVENHHALRIGVPATERVEVALSKHGRADFVTITDAEVHGLGFTAPIETLVVAGLRMQEHTVLNLTPFGIDTQATERQRGERVGLGTSLVRIPSFEYISIFSYREIRNTIVKSGNIVSIRDVLLRMQYVTLFVLEGVSIAVHIIDCVCAGNVVLFNNVGVSRGSITKNFISSMVEFISFNSRFFFLILNCISSRSCKNGEIRLGRIVPMVVCEI